MGLTLIISYSCRIIINNSIDSTNNRHQISGLDDYILNIVSMIPLLFQNIPERIEKSKRSLQRDNTFSENYYSSDEIRSLSDPLDKFKKYILYLLMRPRRTQWRKKETSIMIKISTSELTSKISSNRIIGKSDEDNEYLNKHT